MPPRASRREAQRYQKADIPVGFFRGSPPRPKENVATISIAVRLEARQNLSEEIVTGLTKRLFAMRRSLQSEVPIAAAMEKPDTEKGSAEAVHPGAAAYYDNNEESFMDRYGDWLYISAMAFSGLGSVIAAMFGLARARARKAALALVDQLIEVKQIAHTTTELSRLGGLEAQIEDLSTKGLRSMRSGPILRPDTVVPIPSSSGSTIPRPETDGLKPSALCCT